MSDPEEARTVWQRCLIGAVRSLSRGKVQSWVPSAASGPVRFLRDPEVETRPIEKRLLIVVRTHTSLNRVLELLYALGSDTCLAIKFVIEVGSKFARALSRRLSDYGADEISWDQVKGLEWDAILAAHVDRRLVELRHAGPLMVIAHGAGYGRRRIESTRDGKYSAGLSSYELVHNGVIIPRLLGLSHREQLDRMCPQVRDRALIIGDPVMDKLIANMRLRAKFCGSLGVGKRRLVVVSTTWGKRSLLGQQPTLVKQLIAQLPADEYLVAVLLHPNVWFGESSLELDKGHFSRELDSGLLLVHHDKWEAALIAADVVIGDIGSVTTYAVGLDIPVIIGAGGDDELDDASPAAELHAVLPRLVHSASLREQVERMMADHQPGQWKHITDRIFGLRGESLKTIVTALNALMELPQSEVRVRTKPVATPTFNEGDPITAYRVTADIRVDGEIGQCHVERFPCVVTSSEDVPDSVVMIDDCEVDPTTRDNAEIIVHSGRLTVEEAEEWLVAVRKNCPGIALAATSTVSGVLLRFGNGVTIEISHTDPFAAAAALYWWCVEGNLVIAGLKLELSMGGVKQPVAVQRLVT